MPKGIVATGLLVSIVSTIYAFFLRLMWPPPWSSLITSFALDFNVVYPVTLISESLSEFRVECTLRGNYITDWRYWKGLKSFSGQKNELKMPWYNSVFSSFLLTDENIIMAKALIGQISLGIGLLARVACWRSVLMMAYTVATSHGQNLAVSPLANEYKAQHKQ